MKKMDDKLQLGVVLVEDIPAHMADSEICQFFHHVDNVTSVSVVQKESRADLGRFCWVRVKNPFATLTELEKMEIAGHRLPMRLMGFLFPSQQEEVM